MLHSTCESVDDERDNTDNINNNIGRQYQK